jgi:hypothetical protein
MSTLKKSFFQTPPLAALSADTYCSVSDASLIPASPYSQYGLGREYIEARTHTTQQSGQTPNKEVEIKNITVYVSGYTETPDSRGR